MKILLKELGRRDVDWIDLVQCRDSWRAIVSAVMDLQVPNSGNFLTG